MNIFNKALTGIGNAYGAAKDWLGKDNNWAKSSLTAGTVGGAAISAGNTSTAGNAFNAVGDIAGLLPAPWGPVAGGAAKLIGGLTNAAFGSNLNLLNINAAIASNNSMLGYTSAAGNFDLLATDMNNMAMNRINKKDLGTQGWFSNAVDNMYSGLQKQQLRAEDFRNSSFANNYNNISNSTLAGLYRTDFKFGGYLDGTDYSSGLTYIDEGGTHETNPLGGVPISIDPEGNPNFVEEGETVKSGYVFSNTFELNKDEQKALGIKQKKNLTFADASKLINKQLEEMPNDEITRRTTEGRLGLLMLLQEEKKLMMALLQLNPYGNMFDGGGWLDKELTRDTTTTYNDFPTSYLLDKYLYDGNNSSPYGKNPPPSAILNQKPTAPFNFNINFDTKARIRPYYSPAFRTLNLDGIRKTSLFDDAPIYITNPIENKNLLKKIDSGKFTINTPTYEPYIGLPYPEGQYATSVKFKDGKPVQYGDDEEDTNSTAEEFMKAPIYGSIGQVAMDTLGLNGADYSDANAIQRAASNMTAPQVAAPTFGNYARKSFLDTTLPSLNISNQTNSARRAILNGAMNRGLMAGLLMNLDYNATNQMGDAYSKMLAALEAADLQILLANNNLAQANAQQQAQAALYNTTARMLRDQLFLSALLAAALLRTAERNAVDTAHSANYTNMLNNMGNYGLGQLQLLIMRKNPNYAGDIETLGFGKKK